MFLRRYERRSGGRRRTYWALTVAPQSHLVAPVNFGVFPLGLATNGRILPFQPRADGLWVSFIRSSHGFLRSEAPRLQVPTDGPDRDSNLESFRKEVLHGFACPKRERQSQLIGAAATDQPHSRSRLPATQSGTLRTPARFRFQRPRAVPPPSANPSMHRGPRDSEHTCSCCLREPATADGFDNSLPQHFLRCWRKAACVVTRPHT
jgi:hypothetical protein